MHQASVLHFIITMNFNKLNLSAQETDGYFAYVLGQSKSNQQNKIVVFLFPEECCIIFMCLRRIEITFLKTL